MGYAKAHTIQPHHHHGDHERPVGHHGHSEVPPESVDSSPGGRVSSAPESPRPAASLIEVQADVSPGLVGTSIIGRANQSLRETVIRVRMAINSAALEWPATRRITILLSPADLPKSDAHYDLPMALSVVTAAGQIEPAALEGTVFAGELGLDGGLRPTHGIEAIARAAAHAGFDRIVVPELNAKNLPDIPGLDVIGLPSLGQVVEMLREEPISKRAPG